MYICSNCGHNFEDGEEKRVKEDFGECHGSPSVKEYAVCPVCGSEEFEKANECHQCNRFTTDVEDGLCKACRAEAIDCFNRAMGSFSIAQRRYLNGVYETIL